jgi:sporulation protein YunB
MRPTGKGTNPLVVTAVLGLLFALVLIGILELRLRPVVEQLAGHHVNNYVTKQINDALAHSLSEAGTAYGQLVCVERNEIGAITAVTSDMAQLNRLRAQLVDAALETIAAMDVQTLSIPLGSLFHVDLLWARGPRIQVYSLVSGAVNARITSRFQAAGINQTLHRILLEIQIPLTVLLPGTQAQTQVETEVCVAETVIVGAVPDTYLQLDTHPTASGA